MPRGGEDYSLQIQSSSTFSPQDTQGRMGVPPHYVPFSRLFRLTGSQEVTPLLEIGSVRNYSWISIPSAAARTLG